MQVKFRGSDDRIETFELDETSSNDPSCFLVGMWKGGSSLMVKVMRDLAPFCARKTFELNKQCFLQGLPPSDLREDTEKVFSRPGYVFGVFRWLPENDLLGLEHRTEVNAEQPQRERLLWLVRDPRDALVSLYHSHAKSHEIPKSGPLHQKMTETRERLKVTDIDAYVLSQAPQYLRHFYRTMQMLAMPNVTVLRYEDIVYDKLLLVTTVANVMGADAAPAELAEIAKRHHVIPSSENPDVHIRQVHPGNHKTQLAPETIRQLDEIFAHILDKFDYERLTPADPAPASKALSAPANVPWGQQDAQRETASEPEFVIHIGLPKTGTKSLQVGFRTASNLHYVHSLNSGSIHSRALSNYVGVGWDVLASKAARAAYPLSLATELNTTPHHLRVASDETLCQIHRINWDRFATLLEGIPGKIRFVLVLRPFYSWLESLLVQFAKMGNLDFQTFKPGRMKALNRYPLNFLEIHDAYAALVARLGERAVLQVLPYSPDMITSMSACLNRDLSTLTDATYAHRSPGAFSALAQFAEVKGMVAQMPQKPARFLGQREVDALHKSNADWMSSLAEILGWDPRLIDDYQSFSEKIGMFSYIRHGKAHFITQS